MFSTKCKDFFGGFISSEAKEMKNKSNEKKENNFAMIIFKILFPKGKAVLGYCLILCPLISRNAPAPQGLTLHVKHCLDFSFVFSAPLPA
jgi:hypothetical protein